MLTAWREDPEKGVDSASLLQLKEIVYGVETFRRDEVGLALERIMTGRTRKS